MPDIPAYLTFNINTLVALANGTMVRYHSMSFETDEAHNDLLQKLDCAQPGDTIDLEQPPMSINVEIFPDLDEDDEKTKNMKAEVRK